jgi:3-oxochol-4-en-24-oyl-CoA dehydrogenase
MGGQALAALVDLGIFSIALPESLGGARGTVADVAVVAEQLAAALAPGPVMPTLLAGLALARSLSTDLDDGSLRSLLAAIGAGTATVGAALTAGTAAAGRTTGCEVTATVTGDGRLRVGGTARLVLGATDATHLLLAAVVSWGGDDASEPRVGW